MISYKLELTGGFSPCLWYNKYKYKNKIILTSLRGGLRAFVSQMFILVQLLRVERDIHPFHDHNMIIQIFDYFHRMIEDLALTWRRWKKNDKNSINDCSLIKIINCIDGENTDNCYPENFPKKHCEINEINIYLSFS